MRLLLAEDEKEMANALTAILKHNNYTVDAVYDGQDALDYLESGLYDAAILDIMMPKMDGLTVLRKVREKGITIPILLLTAKSEIDDRVAGLDGGADDYMTKPFDMKELLARVRAMTRRAGDTLTDSTLKFGDLELDRATFLLSCGGNSERLAGREFQMVEMLMSNPGQIISTDHFMEKVWGNDSDAELNVVWVYISNIRKKLGKIGSGVAIRAKRGVGYYLEGSDD